MSIFWSILFLLYGIGFEGYWILGVGRLGAFVFLAFSLLSSLFFLRGFFINFGPFLVFGFYQFYSKLLMKWEVAGSLIQKFRVIQAWRHRTFSVKSIIKVNNPFLCKIKLIIFIKLSKIPHQSWFDRLKYPKCTIISLLHN